MQNKSKERPYRILLRGNYIFTTPGEKAYLASSNFVNYVELGQKDITDYYLEAKIENDEFIVSGRLYNSHGKFLCALEKNNIVEMQIECKLSFLPEGGYQIVSDDQIIFTLFLKERNICVLKGEFYDSKGNLIARGTEQDLFIYKGPAILGKAGKSLGIVISGE